MSDADRQQVAGMTPESTEDTDDQQDRLDERADQIERRLDRFDERVRSIDDRVDALESRVADLGDRLDDAATDGLDVEEAAAVRRLLTGLMQGDHLERDARPTTKANEAVERIEELETRVGRVAETAATLEQALGAVTDADSTGKQQKVAAIVQDARNDPDDEVAFTARELQRAAGVSRRYAYDLMDPDDGLPAEHEWATHRPESVELRGPVGSQEKVRTPKALVVDCTKLPEWRWSA